MSTIFMYLSSKYKGLVEVRRKNGISLDLFKIFDLFFMFSIFQGFRKNSINRYLYSHTISVY